jgi:hypothetical protein
VLVEFQLSQNAFEARVCFLGHNYNSIRCLLGSLKRRWWDGPVWDSGLWGIQKPVLGF